MKKISIYALRDDRKAVLERMQALGAVEIISDDSAADGFAREDKSGAAETFERSADTARRALAVLDETAPEKKGLLASFEGRRSMTPSEFAAFADRAADVLADCNDILELSKQRTENAAQIVRRRTNLAQLEPWKGLDVPFCFDGTKRTAAFIGSLPALYTEQSLAEALAAADSEIIFDIEIISASPVQTCVFVLCPIDMHDATETALRSLGFARPVGGFKSVPADKIARQHKKITALEEEQERINERIAEYADRRRDIENMVDYYSVRAEKYRVISRLDQSKHTFVVTGYIPEPDCDRVAAAIEAVAPSAAVEFSDAGKNAPVKLHNDAFAAPAESILRMYSMPGKGDIDPTPIMSFFFYFFFGMMFSDAGYGLIMILATTWAIKKFRPETDMYNSMKLFQYCGISTFAWGLIFGSFFGDAPAVIASTFFGKQFTMPALIDPVNDAVTMLGLSILLGYVQIMVAIGVKVYMCIKHGDLLGAIFDNMTWIVFWTGVLLLAGGVLTGVGVLNVIGAVMMVVAALGIVVMGGRESKGAKRVLKGLYGLYGATSYFGDMMSYSRLMALGITTGVMGQVFNLLGSMLGGGVVGAIFMAVIFVAGHSINFGLNILGAYVHTMRLQYVEMFSKFYEGGGREFTPFAFNSKYIRLQEEIK